MRRVAERRIPSGSIFSLLIIFMIALCVLPVSSYAEVGGLCFAGVDNFDHSYTLTGDGAADVLAVALKQIGKSGKDLGYTYYWCAGFVTDVARLAGMGNAIPYQKYYTCECTNLYAKLISAGATRVSTAKAGDIVFYGTDGNLSHTAIAINSTEAVHGDYNGWGETAYVWCRNATVVRGALNKSNLYGILRPNYPDPKGTIDLNGFLNETNSGGLESFGTVDVYINGSLVSNDTSDYCAAHSLGTTYEIKDIKPKAGYEYLGVKSGATSGKVTASGKIDIRLIFATQGNLYVQGNLDGVIDDSIKDYGTFDVYVENSLRAENCTSFNEKLPNDTTYEIKNIKSLNGKNYDGITSFTGKVTSHNESKVTLHYSTDGTATPDWQVGKTVPGNLDRNVIDVEYKHTYTQQSRTNPGDEWTMIQEGAVQYENDGNPYYDDNDALATSATRVRLGYYYFHYCNNGTTTNYYWKDYLPVKHTISMEDASANFTAQEKGTDGDGSGRKYYYLTHKTGQYAGGIAKCGSSGAQAYYRGGVYQNKKVYRINTYEKVEEWTSTYDASATSTSVRWRLKDGVATEYKGLQLNFVVDGERVTSLDGVAGLDVFINGEQKASNSTTFRAFFPGDFAYQIKLNHIADDKLYRQIEGGELNGTVEESLKTLTLYFVTGVEPTENWKTISENLLPYLDENSEIEYRHSYTQNARMTPGDEWTLIQEGALQYENDGAPYYDDNDALATSETLVRIGYYYFHYCNNGTNANYYWKDYLPIKHTITMEDASANFSVKEQGTDGDGSGRKYYQLTHLNGQWAGGIAMCSSTGTQVYYRGGVYQKKSPYRINTYQKTGEWTTEIDTTASSVEYRIRLKKYAIIFDANGGIFDTHEIFKLSGQEIALPTAVPQKDLHIFNAWNTESDGSGTSYKPGEEIKEDREIVLYAQWEEQESLNLPSGLKTIENEAFAEINAFIVRLPNGCIEIQSRAFLNCSNLRRIYVPASVSSVALDAFDGCPNLCIYAPEGSIAIKVAKYNDIPFIEGEY